MFHINNNIRNLKPYVPGKPVKELERELGIKNAFKLASNENIWGFSPKVKRAIKQAIKEINRYPDGSSYYLKEKISKIFKLSMDNIIIGNGSNEVIEILMRTTLSEGKNIVSTKYSFIVYRLIAQSLGNEIRLCESNDITNNCDNNTSLIIIDNPNNPTGTYISADKLLEIIEFANKNNIIIIIDEAYHEYVSASDYKTMLEYFNKYENLVVTRTFSKAYGLSGLRIGYAVVHKWLFDFANRIREPFNVNSLAQVAALAALDDQDFIRKVKELNSRCLKYYYEQFDKTGLKYTQSQCNFVLVETDINGQKLFNKLLKSGIITRPMSEYGLEKHLRISMGTQKQNKKAIEALKTVLEETNDKE